MAAVSLNKDFPDWKFAVAGALDYEKQSKLNINRIKFLNKNNIVKFLGYVKDMNGLYNKTGLLSKAKDYDSLKKKLAELISNKKKRSVMGFNGRKLAEKEFGLNNVLSKNLEIYDNLSRNIK